MESFFPPASFAIIPSLQDRRRLLPAGGVTMRPPPAFSAAAADGAAPPTAVAAAIAAAPKKPRRFKDVPVTVALFMDVSRCVANERGVAAEAAPPPRFPQML